MKLGLDTFSLHINLAAGEYDFFRTLDWMEELGLEGLQININGPRGRFLGGDPADRDHLERVRRALAQKGFFAEIGGSGTDPARLEFQLRLAAAVGADTLRTLLVLEGTLEETFVRTRRDLEAVLPLSRQLGVRIALENHEDVTAGELRSFLDGVNDPQVGACLDTGNDLVVHGDPLEAARLLAPRAISTHIKDQKLVRVGGTVYSVGVPLGEGDLPLQAQLAAILETGSLDRLLIQDTTGYAARLNPFGRSDLVAGPDDPGLPAYPDSAAAAAAGLLLSLEGLSMVTLREEARRQIERIAAEVERMRVWLG